jgi:hypothetical protein
MQYQYQYASHINEVYLMDCIAQTLQNEVLHPHITRSNSSTRSPVRCCPLMDASVTAVFVMFPVAKHGNGNKVPAY